MFENKLTQICFAISALTISIETEINMRTLEESQQVQFTCNYDLCNTNDTFFKLKSLIDQQYDLTPIRTTLTKNKSIETTEKSNTKPDFERIESTTAKLFQTSNQYLVTSDSTKSSFVRTESRSSSLFDHNHYSFHYCIPAFLFLCDMLKF